MPGFPPPWSRWTVLHHRCFEDCRETQRDVQSLDSARIQWTQQMWIVIHCQWWQLLVIPTWWTICNRTRSDGAIAGHYRPIRMKITTTIIYFSYATAERQRMLLRYLFQDVAMDGRAMEWAAREVAQAWLTFRFIRRLHTRGPTAPRECSSSATKLPLCSVPMISGNRTRTTICALFSRRAATPLWRWLSSQRGGCFESLCEHGKVSARHVELGTVAMCELPTQPFPLEGLAELHDRL